jgi:hypothetical protein
MVAGPLPSGMSRCSVLPSKRKRRSKAEAMLQALMAPVKISVAVACIVECGIAGRGHADCSFSQPASDDCIAGKVACKEVIGAGDEHQLFGIGGGGDYQLLQLLGRGELVAGLR